MLFIESESTDPYENLALEEHVFNDFDHSEEYFILWQNYNSIIVGKYQNTIEEINQVFVDENGIRVARRLSGGGAVYHDKGNLNYTIIVDRDKNPDFEFRLFVIPVIEALKELGVEAEFNGRNDLTIDGRKFSGSSQYAKDNRILHHGCIMLDSNLDTVQNALRVKKAKIESKSIKSVRSRVTTINEHAPERITMDRFKETLSRHILTGKDSEAYMLTQEDHEAVERLVREKYGTWEWNYGRSPACSVRKEHRFPGGLITILMEVESGKIKSIHFFGDFFGVRELSELEAAITGMPLDEHLAERLTELPIGKYIHGLTAEELAGIIR